MTFSGNTIPYKTEWINAYQLTHYKQPVFPVFADEKFKNVLTHGATIKWSYDSDARVQQLGVDGSYVVAAKTVNDEELTVNQRPTVTFRIPATERIQDHRPTQQKWATKAMNRVFWNIDSKVLGLLQAGAANALSAGDFGGTSGAPISATTSNVAAIFAASRRVLRNNNVIYDINKRWSGNVKLDTVDRYPVAAIPAELEEQLLLAIGFKPGDLGDQLLTRGYMNMLFGFNIFVSTALPFTIDYVVAAANATNGDTFTIGGITFTLKTGAVTNPGDILISGVNAAGTATAIAAALTAPFTTSGTYVGLVDANLTDAQSLTANMISAAVKTGTTETVTVKVLGQGTVAVSDTAQADGFDENTSAVHAIFGVSQSIAVVLQKEPELQVSAGSIIGNGATGGYVAQDFVTWCYAGYKVFKQHTYQLVDVPVLAKSFSAPLNLYL